MYNFIVPDYKDNNIINLMSSISFNFNQPHSYPQLSCLDSSSLKKHKNIILIVIDGLGYNFLKKQKSSFLVNHIQSSLTSTFLSTTSCANTAFHVGYPPQQHALTGWDMNLKEVGCITTILPFVPIFGGFPLSDLGFDMSQIMDIKPFHKKFNSNCYNFLPKKISNSTFTNFVSGDTQIIPTSSYKNTFTKMKQILLKKSKKRKFLHAYIPDYDASSHVFGANSKNSINIFLNLDKKIKNFIKSIKDTNTKVIITADHGFVDIKPKNNIWVDDIPNLNDCLSIPITGEPRVRYCHVKPFKIKEFKKIIASKMSKYCWCYKSETIINDNFYGLGKPNKKLFDRVGDFILIMKDGYVLNQTLVNEKERFPIIANHGGVTSNEMLVPLITFDI